MVTYFLFQKRPDGIFGELHVGKSLAEMKKAKVHYHKEFKIPDNTLYILKSVE